MDAPSPARIDVVVAADGTIVYHVDRPPEALPPVRRRDLDAMWHAARGAAARADWGGPRRFRFRPAEATATVPAGDAPTDLVLADRDACCWAAAVDGAIGLASAYGLSLCLRLLALVDLLAHARWTDPLFALKPDGAEIDAALLNAAARLPLTAEARFDAEAMRAELGQIAACRRGAAPAVSGAIR